MKTINYFNEFVDKTGWGDGVWLKEVDKKQWQDEDTGLPCLAVRHDSLGHFCGYVGVFRTHPFYGRSEDADVVLPSTAIHAVLALDNLTELYADEIKAGKISLGSLVRVHGGLTFSPRGCAKHDRAEFEKFYAKWSKWEADARTHPQGDSAQHVKQWGRFRNDFDGWSKAMQSSSVCHVAEPGESDDVWWFGFDCAHAGDWSPGMNKYASTRYREKLGPGQPTGWGSVVEYRDVGYVMSECARLAKQLVALGNVAVPQLEHHDG